MKSEGDMQLSRRAFGGVSAAGLAWMAVAGGEAAPDDLKAALAEAVQSTGNPGAVALVGDLRRTHFHEAFGYRAIQPEKQPAERDTIYDLASVTKAVATTTAVMMLVEKEKLDLDRPVRDFIPYPRFERFTLRQCLAHGSGLPAGYPFYRDVVSLEELVRQIATLSESYPPGTRRLYSDLGFILLGDVVQRVTGEGLDVFCRREIFAPLKMTDTGYRPAKKLWDRCAATEDNAWRGRIIRGEVHDENCFAVGGVTGHAGLFSTAADLAIFCRAFLRGKVLREKTLDHMLDPKTTPVYPWQGLGWRLDPWRSGPSGYLPSRAAFGHPGWTGTSIWMDRATGLFSILLANTCHPTRVDRKNTELRRTFHDAVAKRFFPGRANVHTGLDRLLRTGFSGLRGKRVALLTNSAAVDKQGRGILKVFSLRSDVTVAKVFSPEHGFHGAAEAGEHVADEKAAVPVVSLYGKQKAPTAEQLKGVECLVVDLQDIGARYYTYMDTMRQCMLACVGAGVPVCVLDRPNPIGGALEGMVATKHESPVCSLPIPNRHGMTMGDLATFMCAWDKRLAKLKLTVEDLDGWRPDALFGACQLPWRAPSPNIPTPETALVYAGTCLFEGVEMNEGRGTEAPFLTLGAPWMKPKRVIRALQLAHPGVLIDTVRFTPRAIPGKSTNPRHKDEACRGIRIELETPARVRAFALAVDLLCAIRAEHGDDLVFNKLFDVLAGGPRLREAIQAGKDAKSIIAGTEAELEAFDKVRPRRYVEEPKA